MKYQLFRALTAAAVALAFLLLLPAVGAQTETVEPTATATEEPIGEEIDLDLNNVVKVTEWRYENGVWTIRLEAETQAAVTIVDGSQFAEALTEGDGAASGTATQEVFDLSPGENQLTFDGTTYDGAASISVAPNGDGRIAIFRTDSIGQSRDPVAFTSAIGAVLAASIGAGWFSYRRGRESIEQSDEPEVDRII